MIASTTQLNDIGTKLGKDDAVHAMTDVTGFGLLGHALEMAEGSNKQIAIKMSQVPLLSQASLLAQQGFVTGASHRNWSSVEHQVRLSSELSEWQRHILTDPQTSCGLLISTSADRAEALLDEIKSKGYLSASVIGSVKEGKDVYVAS